MSYLQSTRTTIPLDGDATGAKRIDVVGMFDKWHGFDGGIPGNGGIVKMTRLEIFTDEGDNPQVVIELPYGDLAALRNAIAAVFVSNEHKFAR